MTCLLEARGAWGFVMAEKSGQMAQAAFRSYPLVALINL